MNLRYILSTSVENAHSSIKKVKAPVHWDFGAPTIFQEKWCYILLGSLMVRARFVLIAKMLFDS